MCLLFRCRMETTMKQILPQSIGRPIFMELEVEVRKAADYLLAEDESASRIKDAERVRQHIMFYRKVADAVDELINIVA